MPKKNMFSNCQKIEQNTSGHIILFLSTGMTSLNESLTKLGKLELNMIEISCKIIYDPWITHNCNAN